VLLTVLRNAVIWMLLTSLKDRRNYTPRLCQDMPVHTTFENYIEAWTSPVTPVHGSFIACGCVRVTRSPPPVVSVLAAMHPAFVSPGERCAADDLSAYPDVSERPLDRPVMTQWRALGLIQTYKA